MFKKDRDKLIKVLKHPDNTHQHLSAIKKYVKLFYTKWDKKVNRKMMEPIIKHYFILLESY